MVRLQAFSATYGFAGALEESSKGSAPTAAGIRVMSFPTFTLLMLQLHSIKLAMLVFLTGRFGIAGVAGACAWPAVRIGRITRRHCAHGNDPAQFGDPE